MSKRIIYPNEHDGIVVLIPSENCGLTVEQIAVKDVPDGKPYKIIDAKDIPTERTFRAAWEADFTTFDGVGGAK